MNEEPVHFFKRLANVDKLATGLEEVLLCILADLLVALCSLAKLLELFFVDQIHFAHFLRCYSGGFIAIVAQFRATRVFVVGGELVRDGDSRRLGLFPRGFLPVVDFAESGVVREFGVSLG